MAPDIMQWASGHAGTAIPARLDGYFRGTIANEAYPGIVPAEGGSVSGLFYAGLGPSVIRRLDEFEGEMYERRTVEVTLHEKRVIAASTYLVKAAFLHRLGKDEWDYERFLRCGIEDFRRQYRGYREIG